MRILITASRDWEDRALINRHIRRIKQMYPDAVIVHGDCPRGGDQMADRAARRVGLEVERHPADWNKYGRRAGFIRNSKMVNRGADYCLAFICNNSPGASGCADLAEKAGIKTYRYEVEG